MPYVKVTEQEVTKIVADVLPTTLAKLPYDAQDQLDSQLAKHFMLKGIASDVNSQLKKLDDKIKDGVKGGATELVKVSKNYRRSVELGTPRESFDLDQFIETISQTYPEVMKHKLKEMAADCKKQSAAPVSIKIEYIGDIPASED